MPLQYHPQGPSSKGAGTCISENWVSAVTAQPFFDLVTSGDESAGSDNSGIQAGICIYLVQRHLHSCVCYQLLFGVLFHFESNGNAHETCIFLALPCDTKDLKIFDGIQPFITIVLLAI